MLRRAGPVGARIGTRGTSLAVFMLFTLMCPLPYLVVPVVAFLAAVGISATVPYLIAMAAGQTTGVAATILLRGRPPIPAPVPA